LIGAMLFLVVTLVIKPVIRIVVKKFLLLPLKLYQNTIVDRPDKMLASAGEKTSLKR
jgi:hypothetical protein